MSISRGGACTWGGEAEPQLEEPAAEAHADELMRTEDGSGDIEGRLLMDSVRRNGPSGASGAEFGTDCTLLLSDPDEVSGVGSRTRVAEAS